MRQHIKNALLIKKEGSNNMGFLAVGMGGGIGAMLRYAISMIPYKHTFPLLTLFTNILGAVLIGYIAGIAVKRDVSPNMVLFLKTGVCGGFTTFSTFSLESCNLLQNGQYGSALLYVFFSLMGCMIGVWCGMKISAV